MGKKNGNRFESNVRKTLKNFGEGRQMCEPVAKPYETVFKKDKTTGEFIMGKPRKLKPGALLYAAVLYINCHITVVLWQTSEHSI